MKTKIHVNQHNIARIVYSPNNPLSCGAKVWIETECEVEAL